MIYIKEYPTQNRLKELFEYKDGFLYWKARPKADFMDNRGYGAFKANCEGKIAHSEEANLYKKIKLNDKIYFTHRLIFIWHFGNLTSMQEVDHKDTNPRNNFIDNLRLSDRRENICNTKITSRNTSGVKGVSWDRFRNKWMAQIKFGDKKIRKRFTVKNDAEQFIKSVREDKHGDFHNHGNSGIISNTTTNRD